MKTLDEVIKGFECCQNVECNECPYKILFNDDTHVPCDQLEKDEDAFHYLKEYKANREDPDGDHQQLKKARNLLWEFYQNEPLSWDELKAMEGKPVWVETSCHKYWGLFNGVWDKHGKPHAMFIRGYQHQEKLSQFLFIRGLWQAYRKERG